jgi:imidazolonepropionase-like amidohydrolase
MRTLFLAAGLAGGLVIQAGARQDPVVIRNVTVIDGVSDAARVANIHLQGERITAVSTAPAPAGAQIIDGTGKFAIPGLWDMHVHLGMRPEPGIAEGMILPALFAHGIVGVRDMGGPLESVPSLRSAAAALGVRMLAPGPFIDGPGEAAPFFRRPVDASTVVAAVDGLHRAGADFIKVQAGLSPEMHRHVAKAAAGHRMALAGHIPLAMTAEEVLASGQRSLEHVSPALVGDGLLLFACSSESAALVAELRAIEAVRGTADGAALARREAALRGRAIETYDPARARALGASMKSKDVWITPTLIWSASLRPAALSDDGRNLPMDLVPRELRVRWTDRRKAYISQVGPGGLQAAARLAEASARAVRDMHGAGAKVLAGTDAFDAFVIPGYSLHQELQALVRAGLTPVEALRTATVTAARYRGSIQTDGTLEPGKRADIVLLDASPLTEITNTRKIHAVVAGGRVHDRPELDRVLAAVRTFADR